MTRYIIALTTALLFIAGCAGGNKKKTVPSFQYFEISFEQDGAIVPIESHQVILQKKPFSIIVRFVNPDSIFLNASFERQTQDELLAGKTDDEMPGFRGNGITEELFNKNDILNISKTNFSFWYYNSEDDHRFNEIVRQPDMLICKRNIAKIGDIDNSREPLAVEKIREKTIYLSVMKMEWSDDYSKRIEKKRDYYILQFEAAKPIR